MTTGNAATADAPSTAPLRRPRTRRPQHSGEEMVAQLSAMVDRLIAENPDLKQGPRSS